MKFNAEPVLILALVRAIIVAAVIFGLALPVGADVALLVIVECFIALFTRAKVSPAAAYDV